MDCTISNRNGKGFRLGNGPTYLTSDAKIGLEIVAGRRVLGQISSGPSRRTRQTDGSAHGCVVTYGNVKLCKLFIKNRAIPGP